MKKIILLLILMGFLPQVINAQLYTRAVFGYVQELAADGITYQDMKDDNNESIGKLYFVHGNNSYLNTNPDDKITIQIDDNNSEVVRFRVRMGVESEGYSDDNGTNPTYAPWSPNGAHPGVGNNTKHIVFTKSFYGFTSSSYMQWFLDLDNLQTVEGGEYLNTSECKNFGSMFGRCTNLKSVEGARGWVTREAKTLHAMFARCSSLEDIDVSGWDLTGIERNETLASAVAGLRRTFYGCKKLTQLDVSTWDVSNVLNMYGTFEGCSGFTSLDLSSWTPNKVRTTENMFNGCTNLRELPFGDNFKTENALNMGSMFKDCSSLERLSFGDDFNTAQVTVMLNMFDGCTNLKSITFGKSFSMSSVTSANSANMFANCPKLRYIDFFNCLGSVNTVNRSSGTFNGLPTTTVVYLPEYTGVGMSFDGYESTEIKGVNVVWSDRISRSYGQVTGSTPELQTSYAYRSRCAEYYSEDKTDIELPRDFTTLKADYIRPMSNEYGSAILPYAFTYNEEGCVRPYMQNKEYEDMMHFKDVETVPAHTPFAFKKIKEETDGVHFTSEGGTVTKQIQSGYTYNGSSLLPKPQYDTYEDYSLTVNATRSTNVNESTWDPETHKWTNSTEEKGSPYVDDGTDAESTNINQETNLGDWITRGYYVTEIFNNTVTIGNEPYYVYYIGTKDGEDQLLRADGKTRAYPHRVHFLKKKSSSNGAKSYNLDFGMGDDNIGTAIEAAEMEKTMRETEVIYDMQGCKIAALQKGINIVRMTDGTVKKVIVK